MNGTTVNWLLLIMICLELANGSTARAAGMSRELKQFLDKHCISCHGAEEPQSQIRLDQLTEMNSTNRHLWTLIHEQLASGSMPPADQAQPTKAEIAAALQWMAQTQRTLEPVHFRRLNRRELAAALGNVTGLTADFAYAIPDDGKIDGFDTGADALQDAADSVAQLLQVTRRAVNGIRFSEPANSKIYAANVREAKDVKKVFDPWKADGFTVSNSEVVPSLGEGWLIKPRWLPERGGLTFRLPMEQAREGILRLRFTVSVKKRNEAIPNPHLWIEVGGRDLAYVEISNPTESPRTLDFQVHLADVTADSKGLAITLTNRVEVPYAVEGFPNEDRAKPEDNLPGGTGLFRPAFDLKTLPVHEQPVPFVVLQAFEIEANYRPLWPPPEWNVKRTTNGESREAAAELLHCWLERAWRRPISNQEQQRFLVLFEQQRRAGQSFEEALRATFQSALLAGSFRYLIAPRVNDPHDQFAIASRLSFMFWGTPPDGELLALAKAKKLREPAVLDAQVNRLLNDSRSENFLRPFVTQWLEMGQPITIAMDHLQKQDFRFGRHLKASMQEETIAYISEIFKQNRPASELLASNWTMMNEILAHHYGYEKVRGNELRRVELRADDPRGGGLLGHAGIQSMLCWMGDNWVIYRGAWTLRRVLDDPPPPPPLEVPELLPSEGKNAGKTFRQLLQQHQEDTKCTVCHKHMDPLGFAFQNFDLSGRWRTQEFEKYVKNDLDGKIEWRGTGKARPVDASGKLPRGEEFQSFAECKQLLAQHYQADVVRGLLKRLLLYGTGRQAEINDLAEIRTIMAAQEARHYPMRELLQALVRSPVFLNETLNSEK